MKLNKIVHQYELTAVFENVQFFRLLYVIKIPVAMWALVQQQIKLYSLTVLPVEQLSVYTTSQVLKGYIIDETHVNFLFGSKERCIKFSLYLHLSISHTHSHAH